MPHQIVRFRPSAIRRVSSSVSLRDVSFVRFRVELSRSPNDEVRPGIMDLEHAGEVLELQTSDKDSVEDAFLSCLARFTARGRSGVESTDGNGGDKSPETFVAQADVKLTFEVRPGAVLESEDLKHFAETNGIYNAWPYWREFLSSALARVGLPRLTLPTLALTPDSASKDDSSS